MGAVVSKGPISTPIRVANFERKSIESDIARGITIVCDRYSYSGMIYSAAKRNPNLTLKWARYPEVGLPRPDVVIFLDLAPEEAEKRGGYGDEKYEKREMQQEVKKLFYVLKESDQEAKDMVVVDAGGSIEEVSKLIMKNVENRLDQVEKGELGIGLRKMEDWDPTR
jgi:dTMP kinase